MAVEAQTTPLSQEGSELMSFWSSAEGLGRWGSITSGLCQHLLPFLGKLLLATAREKMLDW